MPVYCSSREDWLCCEIWEHGGRVVKCISRPSGAKWETRHVISFHSRLTRCPRPRDCTARGKGQGAGALGAGRLRRQAACHPSRRFCRIAASYPARLSTPQLRGCLKIRSAAAVRDSVNEPPPSSSSSSSFLLVNGRNRKQLTPFTATKVRAKTVQH